MTEPADTPVFEPDPRHRHENTDVSPAWIGLFALGLAAMIMIVLSLLGGIFWRWESVAKKSDRPDSLVSDIPAARGPQLQDHPSADLENFRRDEQRQLSSYGWIDKEHDVVKIPIELSMKILAERGIPEPVGPPNTVKQEEPAR